MVGEYQMMPSQRSRRSGPSQSPSKSASGNRASPMARRTKPMSLVRSARTRNTETPSTCSSRQALPNPWHGTSTTTSCPCRANSWARSRSCNAAEIRDGT
jgi:hypothetical protein